MRGQEGGEAWAVGGGSVHGGVTLEKKVAKLKKVTNTKCFKCARR